MKIFDIYKLWIFSNITLMQDVDVVRQAESVPEEFLSKLDEAAKEGRNLGASWRWKVAASGSPAHPLELQLQALPGQASSLEPHQELQRGTAAALVLVRYPIATPFYENFLSPIPLLFSSNPKV